MATDEGKVTRKINYTIDEMPVGVNDHLNKLCALRNITKVELVKEALIEYARNHSLSDYIR